MCCGNSWRRCRATSLWIHAHWSWRRRWSPVPTVPNRRMRSCGRRLNPSGVFRPARRHWPVAAVFAYYRWQGWIGEDPTVSGIRRALELAERFRAQPETFADAELIERAFPAWLGKEADVTAGAGPGLANRAKAMAAGPAPAGQGGLPDIGQVPAIRRGLSCRCVGIFRFRRPVS